MKIQAEVMLKVSWAMEVPSDASEQEIKDMIGMQCADHIHYGSEVDSIDWEELN